MVPCQFRGKSLSVFVSRHAHLKAPHLERQRARLALVLLGRGPRALRVVHLAEVRHQPEVVLVLALVVRAVEDAEGVDLDEVRVLAVDRHRHAGVLVAWGASVCSQSAQTKTTAHARLPASWKTMGLGQGSVPSTFSNAITIMLAPSYGLLIS